jgi:hypothetical protein
MEQIGTYDRITHLEEMLSYFSSKEKEDMDCCVNGLLEKLNFSTNENISQKRLLLAYSGGKDSSYMVAYTRILQLLLFKKFNSTFKLRIFTYRHPSVPQEGLENMDRVYTALHAYEDNDMEMLLFNDEEIVPFNKMNKLSNSIQAIGKRDVLLSGHLSLGDGRPTFCNSCNVNFVRSLVVAASYNNYHADVFITGDSTKEMEDYCKWVRNLAKKIICKERPISHQFHGFQGYKAVGQMAMKYYEEIFYDEHPEILGQYLRPEEECNPAFFSIYDYTNYDVEGHWDFLTKYLGFEFKNLSFNFTESDCTSPAIMAHIRATKVEHVFGLTYENGILDYLQLAVKLMKEKKFPDHLILSSIERYLSNPGIEEMRKLIQKFLVDSYKISDENIVCMVFSPFCDYGLRLREYFFQESPMLYDKAPQIIDILQKKEVDLDDNFIVDELTKLSGLSFLDMCSLYEKQSLANSKNITIMKNVLRDDPHKLTIKTRHKRSISLIDELISGR